MGFPAARRLANLPLSLLSVLALWLACAHASGTEPRGEEVLERGGELANAQAERATVTVTAAAVTVWGLTEVPDGSRLQVAFAGVDAITRSELLKAIQVRVASVVTSVESTDPNRRSVVVETVEAVDGLLARSGPLPHGWVRVRRGGEVVIRIWARLEVPRATLETTVRSVLARRSLDAPANGATANGASAAGAPAAGATGAFDPAEIVGGLAP
jgi:hypothetical protein